MDMQIHEIIVNGKGEPTAVCRHGLSPAVECMRDPRGCPCGYAEGLSIPHYPVPAILTRCNGVLGECKPQCVWPACECPGYPAYWY